MAKPFLIGKYLLVDDPENSGFCVFRFKEQLTDALYVVWPCDPNDGHEVPVGAIVANVAMLQVNPLDRNPGALIFLDWETLAAFVNEVERDQAEEDAPPMALRH